jgi:hypothetical protein
MICPPARLSIRMSACAAAVLALSTPLAAQQQPGGFRLPEPTPTPTPAPAGPADERAGVAIPPRAVPSPSPTTIATQTPTPSLAPSPAAQPAPRSSASPARTLAPAPDTASRPQTAAPVEAAPSEPLASDPSLLQPTSAPPSAVTSSPQASAPAPTIDLSAPEDAASALPEWWPWAAGGLGALVALALGALLWRRRKPKVLRLAAPAPAADLSPADMPRLDLTLEITSATRSVMMFTLQYRLTLANRTPRAVNDLSIAVQLACARRGESNAASPGAAQRAERVERIGPHQARSVTGSVQLPIAEIAVLQQGSRPLFIPLMHVTLEGEGQSTLAHSFVIGTPSASGAGRLHPIVLEGPPGSIPDLRAQMVDIPAIPAAA